MRVYSSDIDGEIRNRIRLSVWAYAYEMDSVSLVSDDVFDELAYRIRPEIQTGHEALDTFFREVFQPHTGQWIHSHPDKDGIDKVYQRYFKNS